jgi:ribitol-5-phosphate 2-dehydrogenase
MVVSTVYTIVKPKKIEKSNVEISEIPPKSYLVKVKFTQVCDADSKYYYGLKTRFPYSLFGFRYFFGIRNKKDFEKKYPLVPLHEATGVIEKAGPTSSLKENTRVVLIPIARCKTEKCEFCYTGNENYCKNSRFMSSNAPGFARTYLIQDEKGVAKIPDEVPDEVAIFTEMSAVAYNALESSNINKDNVIAIFGDGYLSYILAVLISNVANIKKENLFIFGKHEEKLSLFKSFSTPINISNSDIPEELYGKIDKIFECVGKRNAEYIINKSIELLKPRGHLFLLGFSEEEVAINSREIIAKNITLKGVNRSPMKYFHVVLDKMRDKKIQELYKKILNQKIKINSIENIEQAFRESMINRKKLLMEWS